MIINGGIIQGGVYQDALSIVASGLQLYLDANNIASYSGTGTTWYDLTTNHNDVNMQNSGGISYTNSGGGYFTLSSGGYFNNPSTTTNLPIGNSPYTLSAWVQITGSWGGGMVGIGANYGSGNSVNAFRTGGTNSWLNYWWGNDLAGTSSLSPTTQWVNAVAQWDGTTRSIWIDSIQIASDSSTGLNIPDNFLQVGATNSGGSESLDGNIGQVLIYNRALSPEEIQKNYTITRTRYGV